MRDFTLRHIVIILTIIIISGSGCIGNGQIDPNLPPAVEEPPHAPPPGIDPPETDPPEPISPNTHPPDSWLAMETAPWSLLYLSDGDLLEIDLAQKTSRAVIKDKNIIDFSPNRNLSLIAYMTFDKEEEDVWLYSTETSVSTHVLKSFMSSGMSWSPGGRFLMVDSGTDIFRRLSFLDTLTDDLREITAFMGGIWSPTGCCLAVALGTDVVPPLEIHDGRTLSVHLFDPSTGELTPVAHGDRTTYWQPYLWNNDGLFLKQDLWADFNSPQYYRYAGPGALVQTAKPRTPYAADIPPEIREWDHQVSPDRNYVLFQEYDYLDNLSMVKVWSRTSYQTYNIAIGHSPYWN